VEEKNREEQKGRKHLKDKIGLPFYRLIQMDGSRLGAVFAVAPNLLCLHGLPNLSQILPLNLGLVEVGEGHNPAMGTGEEEVWSGG
jgi:hypothetical protein